MADEPKIKGEAALNIRGLPIYLIFKGSARRSDLFLLDGKTADIKAKYALYASSNFTAVP